MEEAKAAEAVELRLEPMYVPATVTADWDAITANVRRMVAPYEGVTADEAALMDLKEAKACCADLRRISRELNDGRKAVKRKYNEPLAAFEAKVKEIDALIRQPLAVVDEAVKIAERRERDGRRARLEQAYEDFAPALAPVVPFERVLEPQWLNKSFGQRKAELELTEKVAGIAADWESFRRVRDGFAFPDEAEAEFFRTLSLRAANDLDASRREEAGRIAALKAEVAANRGEEPGGPCAVADDGPETPEIAAEAERCVDALSPTFEPVLVYDVRLECTERQKAQVMDAFRRIGVHGTIRERKEAANA